jgi:hypothetical protein
LDGYYVQVTSNLQSALKHIRSETETVAIWVDALCINQEDLEEKNLQILRMRSIYKSADEVIAWIGIERCGVPNPLLKLQELA